MSKEFSRRLRNNTTIHERCLWDALRGRQLEGCRFRRQVSIGNFIADFVCLERRLIIELDGAFHGQQKERDEARTAWLESQGFLVLRYWNSDVFDDLEAVLEGIAKQLRGREGLGNVSAHRRPVDDPQVPGAESRDSRPPHPQPFPRQGVRE